jgi:hypothetical protein
MWSLILYFLFGIGQPSNSQPSVGIEIEQSTDGHQPNEPGDNGGETSTPIPPRPPKGK